MITPTVLHAGFINEQMVAAMESPQYAEAVAYLNDWGASSVHREAAIAVLNDLKLDAWAAAGAKYRRALAVYERHVALTRMLPAWHWARRQTAIEYQDPPKPPLVIDFSLPA